MDCPLCHSQEVSPYGEAQDKLVSKECYTLMRCRQCGFIYTAKAPQSTALAHYYQSEAYVSHSNTRKGLIHVLYHIARKWMLYRKGKLVKRYTHTETPSLLDIGSGTGYFAHYMQQLGYRVSAIEQSQGARDFCFQTFGLQPEANLLTTQLKPLSQDVITLWHVLEHLEDLEQHINVIGSLLRPKGTLIIALPNPTSHDAMYYGSDWAAYDVPRHLWHFSPQNIIPWLQSKGFVVKAIRPMWLDVYYIALLTEQQLGHLHLKGWLRALRIGFVGSLKTLRHREAASSLIYIFGKE